MKKIIIILVILVLLVLGLSFLKQHDGGVNRVKDNLENNNNLPAEVVQNEENVIVGENPEGEADPDRMKLDMTTWNWIKTVYSDGKIVAPNLPEKFTLTFDTKAKTFSASTDCNGVGGEYTIVDGKITFDKMMSTLMYCEGSQEAEFSKMLTESSGFLFTSRGELVLTLKYDSGSVYFR